MTKYIIESDCVMKGIAIHLFALVIYVSTVLIMRNIMYPCLHEAVLSGWGRWRDTRHISTKKKKIIKKITVKWNRKRSIENKCLRRMGGIDNLNAESCAEKM